MRLLRGSSKGFNMFTITQCLYGFFLKLFFFYVLATYKVRNVLYAAFRRRSNNEGHIREQPWLFYSAALTGKRNVCTKTRYHTQSHHPDHDHELTGPCINYPSSVSMDWLGRNLNPSPQLVPLLIQQTCPVQSQTGCVWRRGGRWRWICHSCTGVMLI